MPLSRRFPGTTREAGSSQPAEVINLDAAGNVVVPISATVGTATVAQVTASTTVVTLAAVNTARRGLAIYNDSKKLLHLKLGTGAALSDFSVQIDKGGYYELPQPIFTGEITGIWDAVDGEAHVTELS